MERIVIVGAGPIGCYLAQLLKKQGQKPLLIEEHKELGQPVHCAGLVGRKVFGEIKKDFLKDSIINTINGIVMHLGSDRVELKREGVAYVINREEFDKKMGEGLDIRFETKYLGLQQQKNGYVIETDKEAIEADIVVAADGARSLVREFVIPQPMNYLKGVQFRMKFKTKHPDMVQVFIERPYFYWIIPESEDIVRIGVLSKNPYQDLLNFLKERKVKGKILEKFAGIVPLTHFASLSKGRVFLVGDSASQIKPLSYGGVYLGMRAAEMLADCINKKKYDDYSSCWMKRFGKEITIALRAREIFRKLTDRELKAVFSFVKKKAATIAKKGDFESHFSLAWELLKDPLASREIVGILLKIIRMGFGGEFRKQIHPDDHDSSGFIKS